MIYNLWSKALQLNYATPLIILIDDQMIYGFHIEKDFVFHIGGSGGIGSILSYGGSKYLSLTRLQKLSA